MRVTRALDHTSRVEYVPVPVGAIEEGPEPVKEEVDRELQAEEGCEKDVEDVEELAQHCAFGGLELGVYTVNYEVAEDE